VSRENDGIVLLQVLFVLMSVEVYSGLQTCVIEGIEALSNKFQNIFLSIKKKQYDVLDHRKPEFDRDFDEYQKYLFDLEVIVPLYFIIKSFVKLLYSALILSLLNIVEKFLIVLLLLFIS